MVELINLSRAPVECRGFVVSGVSMAFRVCLDCPAIGRWPRGRCPEHDQTQAQRGYGYTHRRESERWIAKVRAGERVTCWRCGEPITDPDDCHLGHDDADRDVTRGPEHGRRCNLQAAGRNSHMS